MNKIAIALLSSLFTFNVVAQNKIKVKPDSIPARIEYKQDSPSSDTTILFNEYANQLEQAVVKEEKLTKRKKELLDSLNKAKSSEKELSKLLKKTQSEVSKYRTTIQKFLETQKSNGYEDLNKRKEQLLSSIKQNKKILNDLHIELKTVNTQLGESNNKKVELDKIKQEVGFKLVEENEQYLQLPFSQMATERLRAIRKNCVPFTAEQKINAFVVKIDNTITNRAHYEYLQKVLNSKYDKSAISIALSNIQSMTDLSFEQKAEITALKKQLEAFGEGVSAFKEFINNLNRCRKGVNYSMAFFRDDKRQILPDKLEQKISTKLMIVPYLKSKYEGFMKAFQKSPNKHSDIETEILHQ